MPEKNMPLEQRQYEMCVTWALWLVASARQDEIDSLYKGSKSPINTVFEGMSIPQIVHKCDEDKNLRALLPQTLRLRLQEAGFLLDD